MSPNQTTSYTRVDVSSLWAPAEGGFRVFRRGSRIFSEGVAGVVAELVIADWGGGAEIDPGCVGVRADFLRPFEGDAFLTAFPLGPW